MGNTYQIYLEKILDTLGHQLSQQSSVYIFGSYSLGLSHRSSDLDVLILTKKNLSPQRKKIIIQALKPSNINAHLFSWEQLLIDVNHSNLEAAALESALRNGVRIHGDFTLRPRMSDQEQALSMLVGAALFLHQRIIGHYDYQIKELCRTTFLLWHLENKLALAYTYSPGHYVEGVLSLKLKIQHEDELWPLLDRTGILWTWLDEDMRTIIGISEMNYWKTLLALRLKKFYSLFNSLNFKQISDETLSSQAHHPLMVGVIWTNATRGNKLMKDGGLRLIINLLKIIQSSEAH